jgi:hypothetical protein
VYLTHTCNSPASRAHRTDVRDSATLLSRATPSAREKQEPEDHGRPGFLNRLVLRPVQARRSVDNQAIPTRSELSEDSGGIPDLVNRIDDDEVVLVESELTKD